MSRCLLLLTGILLVACASQDTTLEASGASPCPLGGRWGVLLRREARPNATGHLTLTDTFVGYAERTRWRGRYELDPTPLFGEREGGVNSTSVGEGSEDEIRFGVEAGLRDSTTVFITFSPLVSHGPLGLSGTLRGDSVVGEWGQRSEDFMNAPRGTFMMWRESACLEPSESDA